MSYPRDSLASRYVEAYYCTNFVEGKGGMVCDLPGSWGKSKK